MKIAYFDCFSGAGGDMIVGALADAGADVGALQEGLSSLKISGYALTVEKVNKEGFAATRFNVTLKDSESQPHRHLRQVLEILNGSSLPDSVIQSASRVFERLAQAEAAVHGTSIEKVHFHEVGAVDAILDIAGAMLAMELLGVEKVHCSPIPTGRGTVTCAHGILPIPAPATAQLLAGVPIYGGDVEGELTTPTAAAVLTTVVETFGPLPAMQILSVGYGAGTRDGGKRPNLLRVLVGESGENGDADEITVLETNLDDASPEVIGFCTEQLLEAGALDVYTVPIHMKKSRSGVVLTVLCEHRLVAELERIVFAETTTFGLRRTRAVRSTMRRRHESVNTPFGQVRIKVGQREGITTASPEYDDCRSLAVAGGVPLRTVIAAAHVAWAEKCRGT